MDKPRNIFEQILSGVLVVNENIVALSEEIAALREDMAYIKGSLLPSDPASGEEKKTGRTTAKK